MIRYAGVELSKATPRMRQHFERWWRPENAEYYRPSGSSFHAASHLSFPPSPEGAVPRLGCLHWPAGASRWATYYQLISGDQLRRLRAVFAQSLSPYTGNAQTFTMSDDSTSGSTITTSLYMLPPKPVSTAANEDECIWLICLVDERWLWWSNGPFGPLGKTTWTDLITSALSLTTFTTPTIDTIPTEYLAPVSGRWDHRSIPLPLFVDAACIATGGMLSRSLDGTIRVYRPDAAKSAQLFEWNDFKKRLSYGGVQAAQDIARALPSRICVFFDTPNKNGGGSEQENIYLSNLSEYIDSSIVNAGGNTGDVIAGGQIYAEVDPTCNNSTNAASDRLSYATKAAQDWYTWRLAGLVDATFAGIINWNHTPAEMAVEWRDGTGDEPLSTCVKQWPMSDWNTYGSAMPERDTGWVIVLDDEADSSDTYSAYYLEPDGTGLYIQDEDNPIRYKLIEGSGETVVINGIYWATRNGTSVETLEGVDYQRPLYHGTGNDIAYVKECLNGVNGYRICKFPHPIEIGDFVSGSP